MEEDSVRAGYAWGMRGLAAGIGPVVLLHLLADPGTVPLFSSSGSLLIGLGVMAGLEHPVRRRIYDHLRRLPGDHFRSVARSLKLALGTTRHHLDSLQRDGLVYREDANGRARYYVVGKEPELNRLYARHWEYRDLRLRVLFAVRRIEDARPTTIAKALGISRQLAAYHLASLERTGHVRRKGNRYLPVR